MFILDDLYVSKEVLDYLEESKEPILGNDTAYQLAADRDLHICSSEFELEQSLNLNPRICTLSEMNLDAAKEIADDKTKQAIELCKDKAQCRRVLAPLFPDYHFGEYQLGELLALDPDSLSFPVVIKPSTGFFSIGIYPVFTIDDWKAALAEIKAESATWSGVYNETVANDSSFLVESYITGDEYAIDAYYDNKGEVVLLNILRHEFSGSDDVSDRLYYSSKTILETYLEPMRKFLIEVNEIFQFRDFPFHVEVRIRDDGSIIPIEFNPLRFAGLCTTDLSFYAYGFKTYDYFLNNVRPDWKHLLSSKDDSLYTMILLTKAGFDESQDYHFYYEALKKKFRKILALREVDFSKLKTFGFLFTETKMQDIEKEIKPILQSTLDEYLL